MNNFIQKRAKIFVAGHRGLAGSAIVRKLRSLGYENLLLRTRQELDLQDLNAVGAFFEEKRPEFVFLAAAKVGGILANRDFPADFIAQNLRIQSNVIESAYRAQVKRLPSADRRDKPWSGRIRKNSNRYLHNSKPHIQSGCGALK